MGNVAPTTELNGKIARSGDAVQSIVNNRSEWFMPRLISTIELGVTLA